VDGDEVIQYLFWLFDSEPHARSAEALVKTLRDLPEAPAVFVGVDLCAVVGQGGLTRREIPTASPSIARPAARR
jgi:hypothetical protein